ncbi:hypothetical protein J437_LFUL009407 [Ladona fulva]|uniref:Vacuolar protein sorting-associated protein 13B n=1 Tax=Ladona fulva TaxID=123851 RepID=A0A8K0NY39_LADFU|nr:hypothetical protein J437_LFUL009407 [Ladona fulva]
MVVLSPLFAMRSFLPVSAEVEVSSPELRVIMHAVAKGRGTVQELYCPGTTATSHVLTFNLEDQHTFEVPLSYQMLQKSQQGQEETEVSKKIDKAASIEEILRQLKETFKDPEPRWPFVGEEFNGVDWVAGPLSQTDIEVSYVNPGPHCSTLLVQVRPKVLLVNVLGIEIYLTSEVEESLHEEDSSETVRRVSRFHVRQALCSVPHHGVIAAPKLEGIFHLGIRLMDNEDFTDEDEKTGEDEGGEMFFSPPLQLSTAEWAGNKPHISGVVPLEGSARTRILCGKYVCFVVITSAMTPHGVRVLTVRPMYTICNNTLERLRLSTLCYVDVEAGQKMKRRTVPHSSSLLDIPPGEDQDYCSRNIKNGQISHILGWPVILWSLVQPENQESKNGRHLRLIGEQKLEPYLQFGMDSPGGELFFGCPIKIGMSPENPVIGVTQSIQPRRVCFTIPISSTSDKNDQMAFLKKARARNQMGHGLQVTNRPFVLTVHEKEGQNFLLIHDDQCPQMEVQNLCNFDVVLGEAEKNLPWAGPSDAVHFQWLTLIQSGTSVFYSLPSRSLHFPDIYKTGELPSLVIASGDLGTDEELSLDMWSECIRVDDNHSRDPEGQFLRLFPGRDVRVRVEERHNHSHFNWGKGCSTTVTIEPAPRASVLAKDVRERLGATQESSNTSVSNAAPGIEVVPSNLSYYSTSSTFELPDRTTNSSTSKLVVVDSSSEMFYDASERPTFSFFPSSLSFLLSPCNLAAMLSSEELERIKPSWQLNCSCLVGGFQFSLMDDLHPPWERTEVILLSVDDICLLAEPSDQSSESLLRVTMTVGDCQLDNQQLANYDFPVIFMRDGTPYTLCVANKLTLFSFLSKPKSILEEIHKEALLNVTAGVKLGDSFQISSLLQTLEVIMKPVRVYLEDRFDLYLMDICLSLLPSSLVLPHSSLSLTSPQFNEARDFPQDDFPPTSPWSPGHVFLPQGPFFESMAVAKPLRLKLLSLGPASLLVSLHTYAGVYIAANHSPLQFSAFERTHVFSSSYELGRALTLHYRSGVLLCAGWVLGSLELLGSPGGLACTVGRGIRDFLHLPLEGILQGPWGFVLGVLHGSTSLMKHITAGTVTSVTMLASSVARNLDQLTLDEEHMRRTEEIRRSPPKGVAQGLLRGLTGLGISLLGAVSGIVHHPMQSMVSDGSQSLVSGVGKGLVGVITKPLSGAAELVALTGQGLLHGTGWANLPLPKQPPLVEKLYDASDAQLKYIWKVLPLALTIGSTIPSAFSAPGFSQTSLSSLKCLMIIEAMSVSSSGIYTPVTLILTAEGILIVELDEKKESTSSGASSDFFWIPLKEVDGMEPSLSDPTLLRLQLTHTIEPVNGPDIPAVTSHSHILEYVKNTCVLVCPIPISGTVGPSAVNDCTSVPPAPDQMSVPSTGANASQDSSGSQSPHPKVPHSTSPDASISSHSSLPSLMEKSGSCSAEPSDQPITNFDEDSIKLYNMAVHPGLPLTFHVGPAAGAHFLSLLKVVKRQFLGKGYPVL